MTGQKQVVSGQKHVWPDNVTGTCPLDICSPENGKFVLYFYSAKWKKKHLGWILTTNSRTCLEASSLVWQQVAFMLKWDFPQLLRLEKVYIHNHARKREGTSKQWLLDKGRGKEWKGFGVLGWNWTHDLYDVVAYCWGCAVLTWMGLCRWWPRPKRFCYSTWCSQAVAEVCQP